MKRRKIDATDILFVVGVLFAGGGAWWMTGHPGVALIVTGVAMLVLGFVGIVLR